MLVFKSVFNFSFILGYCLLIGLYLLFMLFVSKNLFSVLLKDINLVIYCGLVEFLELFLALNNNDESI
jgi:hypothetical protein